jgi:multimeric flavodoxin WrbA
VFSQKTVTNQRSQISSFKFKRVIAFNGSGRKNWNTGQLAAKFLDGVRSAGAVTEIVPLGGRDFHSCQGGLSCTLIDTSQDTDCILKDDLTPSVDTRPSSGLIAFATPLYYIAESGQMRCCLERILFQFLLLTTASSSRNTPSKRKLGTCRLCISTQKSWRSARPAVQWRTRSPFSE